MPIDYADQRIQKALELSNGDNMKAREQLTEWAHKDPKLLLALAEPHLQGIIAYNIEQFTGEKKSGVKKPVKNRKTRTGKGTDFGLGILKAAVSSRAEIFGLETATGGKETEASQEHIDAIHRLAKKPGSERP